MKEKLEKSEEEWKKELTPEQYAVLREGATEAPFTGKFVHTKDKGVYTCIACGQALFSSDVKFDSKTGWPSFADALPGAIETHEDRSHGMVRTEIICAKCGSHLGHMFDDLPASSEARQAGGPTKMPDGSPASGKRYCVNSVCLDLEKNK